MKRWMRALLIVGTLALLVVSIWVGYRFDVTGFAAAGNPKTQQYQPAKTLWDWLQLLIVPAVLAGATLWFNAQQGKTERQLNYNQSELEREIAQDQQRENALQTYLDRMADLLLEKHLRESQEEDEIRQVARARTLTVLRRLDAARKTALVQFLFEAKLVGNGHNIIDLSGANLSRARLIMADLSGAILRKANLRLANLHEAHLSGAKLREAILSGADLSEAKLREAILNKANLSGADLSWTNLSRADLSGANLSGADLSEANLSWTDLSGANLSYSTISPRQLKDVKSLENTTLPDGTKHADALQQNEASKDQ